MFHVKHLRERAALARSRHARRDADRRMFMHPETGRPASEHYATTCTAAMFHVKQSRA